MLKLKYLPYYQVKSKEIVKSGDPAKFFRRNTSILTEFYKFFMLNVESLSKREIKTQIYNFVFFFNYFRL